MARIKTCKCLVLAHLAGLLIGLPVLLILRLTGGVRRFEDSFGFGQDGDLVNFGSSYCSFSDPCPACYGDCDNDSECEGSLQCFQRSGTESVPGCSGRGSAGVDYCYRSSSSSNELVDNGFSACTASNPCPKCTGDCDSDAECEGSLRCFERDNFTPVPGCSGSGSQDVDYCTDADFSPPLMSLGISACTSGSPCSLCEGDCDSNFDCAGTLVCFERNGFTPVPGCEGAGQSDYDYCVESGMGTGNMLPLMSNGFSNCNGPCPRCQGDCDGDSDCAGDLVCFQRDGTTSVPGCSGLGESDVDYCILNVATPAPTPIPTRTPTPAPTPTSGDIPLSDSGFSGCSPTNQCTRCHGDCDSDSDCVGSLVCHQRDDTSAVPGCLGSGTSAVDYCIGSVPLVSNGLSGCSFASPCPLCHGDCDNDADCMGNLICYLRDFTEPIPGCTGTGVSSYDYCTHP